MLIIFTICFKWLQWMDDNHYIYLKTDVLLLADVFEKFISTCIKYYKLDPWHFFNSPTLSWDAMLKMPERELELISDIDMYWLIEKGMRGGTSYIAKRHSKSNNKYINTCNHLTLIYQTSLLCI